MRKRFVNSSGGGIAETLDAHYYKGPGFRQGTEREYIVVISESDGIIDGEQPSRSYCGQDAYNDMFVTEKRYANELGRHTDSTDIDEKQCRWKPEDAGQRKLQLHYRGGY